MNKLIATFLTSLVLLFAFSAPAQAQNAAPTSAPSKPTILVCGDSTSKFSGGETMDLVQCIVSLVIAFGLQWYFRTLARWGKR